MQHGINLQALTHANHTDFKKGKVNNHDAALLVLAASPDTIATSRDIREKLQTWRGKPLRYLYLFNSTDGAGYGYVGSDKESRFKELKSPYFRETVGQRRTYWYRIKDGVYGLTYEGMRRLAELKTQAAYYL